jgi:hypothetical protein
MNKVIRLDFYTIEGKRGRERRSRFTAEAQRTLRQPQRKEIIIKRI